MENILIQNYHILQVIYGNDTMRVTSKRFDQYITIRKNHSDNHYLTETIIPELQKRGFNIIGKGEFGQDKDILITDTFKPFKETTIE